VLATQPCRPQIPRQSAADAFDFIGRDGLAVTAAAENDASLSVPKSVTSCPTSVKNCLIFSLYSKPAWSEAMAIFMDTLS
jgi:hypothetical protein